MNLEEARSILLEHSRSEKNGKFPLFFHFQHKITNPICGDHVELRVFIHNHCIEDLGFLAKGCAICSASTSMMSQHLRGQTIARSLEISNLFEQNILASTENLWPEPLLDFRSFEHLRVNPSRRACALLPWVVLRSVFHHSK